MRSVIAVALGSLLMYPEVASAQQADPLKNITGGEALSSPAAADPQAPAPAPVAVEYSDAYKTRAKIHKYASFASLPLFATEVALGQSVYSSPSDGKRSAHVAVGMAIGGLFGVNTVTGAWNMWESRKDPHGR